MCFSLCDVDNVTTSQCIVCNTVEDIYVCWRLKSDETVVTRFVIMLFVCCVLEGMCLVRIKWHSSVVLYIQLICIT